MLNAISVELRFNKKRTVIHEYLFVLSTLCVKVGGMKLKIPTVAAVCSRLEMHGAS